jgi:hypothetical protein
MTAPVFAPFDPDVFGPAAGGHTVRQAVRDTLQTWTPTYIALIAQRLGLDMAPFQQWIALSEYRALPQNYTAACWPTCLGTRGTPQRQGNGIYRAAYGIEVSTLVYGGDWDQTEDLTSAYNLAARMALLQHRDLGGVADALGWISETYAVASHTNTRTLGVYRAVYEVWLPAAVQTAAGPPPGSKPPVTPVQVPAYPTVDQFDIAIEEPL